MRQSIETIRHDTMELIDHLLHREQIWSIQSVGWSSEWEPDPEFIGHAMWQLDGPKPEQTSSNDEEQSNGRKKQDHVHQSENDHTVQQELAVNGEEFYRLMESARLSIGQAVLWYPSSEQEAFPTAQPAIHFWSHRIDAYVKLSMASERLRYLLISATTRLPLKVFKTMEQKRCTTDENGKIVRWWYYNAPFENIELLLDQNLHTIQEKCPTALAAVKQAGTKIFRYRQKRNKIVHEMATQMAGVIRDLYTLHREIARTSDRGKSTDKNNPIETPHPGRRTRHDPESTLPEFLTELNELKNWYNLMLVTSSHVFEIEYYGRAQNV